MRHLKIDLGDYEFLGKKAQYVYELDTADDPHAKILIRANASLPFSLWLEGYQSEMFPLWEGSKCHFELSTAGFIALHIKTTKENILAVSVQIGAGVKRPDPTPVSASFVSEREETVQAQIRREFAAMVQESGLDLTIDDFDLSPLDGDFDEDDAVIEGLSPHQVAEFHRSTQPPVAPEPDDSDDTDDQSDPDDLDDPENPPEPPTKPKREKDRVSNKTKK